MFQKAIPSVQIMYVKMYQITQDDSMELLWMKQKVSRAHSQDMLVLQALASVQNIGGTLTVREDGDILTRP